MPADAARPPAARPADPNMPIVPEWPFRYELTIASFDGAPLAVRYYPSQLGAAAPVVLLVHDLGPGRSIQDFDASVADLEGQGIASHLQKLDYAVLAVDLRGHGQSPVRARGTVENPLLRWIGDLQAAYRFLLDRHNRRELNLAKFAVVALGHGGNLAAHWATAPGGAVSIEGRTSDLAAMALISPRPTLNDRPIEPAVTALAPRLPILLQAGAGDAEGSALLDALRPAVERQRLSRVTLTETRLPATNLLRFAPGATAPLIEFLDGTVKVRADEWEPRYNLDPVVYTNVRVTNLEAGADAEADAAPAPRRPQPAAEAGGDAEADGDANRAGRPS
jgi:alpha-beta hydrolase superfamily lysophospholipase